MNQRYRLQAGRFSGARGYPGVLFTSAGNPDGEIVLSQLTKRAHTSGSLG